MATKVIPTKANLLQTKASLEFAKKGYDLLDKKRTVLIKEMMDLNKKAAEIQNKIVVEFAKTYRALEDATITMGTESIFEVSKAVPIEDDYEVKFRSVMGVELPKVKYEEKERRAEYSFHRTTSAFDEASIDLHVVKYLIYELAEVENSVFKLAQEIKKTQKRANALDKIQIPKYTKIVKEIENILQEKEREDFFRLKKVKDKKNRK